LQAHWQAAQTESKAKLAKEPAKPAQLTALWAVLGLPTQKTK